jgi:integrase
VGVYRRKKDGKYHGPWIVKFPHKKDAEAGRIIYTTCVGGHYRKEAEAVFQQKMTEWRKKIHLGVEAKKDYTVRELIDWYLDLPGTPRLRTYSKIQQHCRRLKAHFGHLNAREIKPSMIEQFQQKRLAEVSSRGARFKPASVNREIEVFKRIYNLAIREDLVEKNPCWKVARLPEDNARDRVLSDEELESLLAQLPPHAADLVILGYYTGMRFGEIVGLTWERVNLREGYLDLTARDTKTREPRRVYFSNEVRDVLTRARKVRGLIHAHVFTYKERPIKSIKVALASALKKTGIEDFRFHDLRHTFVTNMRRAGNRQTVIMKLTGHKTLSMFARYDTIEPSDAREAMRRLDALLGSKAGHCCNIAANAEKGLRENPPTP